MTVAFFVAANGSQLQPADAGIIRNLKSNLENVFLYMLHPC